MQKLSLSKVLFLILYFIDIYMGYQIFGFRGALITGVAIVIAMFGWMRITLYQTGALHIEDCSPGERNRLDSALQEIYYRAESCGYKLRKCQFYVSGEHTMNAYNCLNKIVINRPVLQSAELEGIITHELGHLNNWDSYFSMLLSLNIMAISVLIMVSFALYFLVVAIIVIVLAFLSKNFLGFLICKKILEWTRLFNRVACNIIITVIRIFQMTLLRQNEYKADRFAVRLGYGQDLKSFLGNYTGIETRNTKTFLEMLLSTHPSDYKRIAAIQKEEEKIRKQRYDIQV